MASVTLAHFADAPHLRVSGGASSVGPLALLERDEPLAVLSRSLESAMRSGGGLVSVSGEAGIGKSSLLEAFARRDAANADFLWGGCDALGTPSPLGPLFDLAADLGAATAARLRGATPRHEIFAAFVEDLAGRPRPTVVIFEDVHWADAATLDLLTYAGRRIDRTRALLVITWRDDEIDVDHRMHRLLGDWPHGLTTRIQLPPLSVDAVRTLAAGARDAAALHAVTGGNPFFVTEALCAGTAAVPETVRDAVLARRAGLADDARIVLDFVSIVPSRAEYGLLDAALDASADAIERCVAVGLLKSDSYGVTFRHELARMAVAGALPSPRTHRYHRLVLDALLARADRTAVLARIVHHAEACGADDAIVEHAPAAARQAACLGAHREAVEHYRRAIEHRDRLTDEAKAQLFESSAYEHYVTGDMRAAYDGHREALALWQRLGVTLAIGRNMRALSRMAWFVGNRAEAELFASEAVDLLRTLPPTTELAMACSNRAQLDMLRGDLSGCVAWGTEAIDLARRMGASDVVSHALNNVGAARVEFGDSGGLADLEESLELALAGDFHEHAARAFTNLASSEITSWNYTTARQWLQRGITYCAGRDLEAWSLYMLAWRARLGAETGAWTDACTDAQSVLGAPMSTIFSRIAALSALGVVYVRQGRADAVPALDEALALARRIGERQRLMPILAARAELAWFSGRSDIVAACAREALDSRRGNVPSAGGDHLSYWLWKAGLTGSAQGEGVGPYAQLVRGEWKAAAAEWAARGRPYEEAEALMEGSLAAVASALEIFQTLGARPAVEWARQRLRQLGAPRLPRGRRASTRAHPAGLTARETEVLAMLASDLTNPQLAARLFVSRKTVEHHVSSILAKLEVPSRAAAVVRAREEGWISAVPDRGPR